MTYRHKCKDYGCYLEVHAPDWAFLKGAFPRGITPSDLDGFVEINGYCLTLEWKGQGQELTTGQAYAFQRRTLSGYDFVFILYGDSEKTECREFRMVADGRVGDKRPASNKTIFDLCERWQKWVESMPDIYAKLGIKPIKFDLSK